MNSKVSTACLFLILALFVSACREPNPARIPTPTDTVPTAPSHPASTTTPSPTEAFESKAPGPPPHILYEIGRGSAELVAWSPDGRELAVAGSRGVYLYDARTFRETSSLPGVSLLSGLAFSPDGRSIALLGNDGVRLVEVGTGEILANIPDQGRNLFPAYYARGEGMAYIQIRCPPDGCLSEVHLLDISAGGLPEVLELPEAEGLPRHYGIYRSLAASPDGTLLAAAGEDGVIWVWEIEGWQLRYALSGHQSSIEYLEFSPDGSRLASASRDASLSLWQVETGGRLLNLPAFGNDLDWLAFAPDGNLWAAEAGTGLRLFDPNGQLVAGPLPGFSDLALKKLRLDPGGARLAEPLVDEVRVWDLPTGGVARRLTGFANLRNVLVSPTGRYFTTQPNFGGSQSIEVYETLAGRLLHTFGEHREKIEGMIFTPDGRLVASYDAAGVLLVWQLASGEVLARLQPGYVPLAIAFSPDLENLASAGPGKIDLWRIGALEPARSFWIPTRDVTGLAFSSDGDRLFFNREKQVNLYQYSLETGKLLGIYRTNPETISTFLGFYPADRATAWLLEGRDADHPLERLLAWDLEADRMVQVLEGDISFDYTPRLFFSPIGRLVYFSTAQESYWDLESGQPVPLEFDPGENATVAGFGPDGDTLLVTTPTGGLQLWDIAALSQAAAGLEPVARTELPAPTALARPQQASPELAATGPGLPQPGTITASQAVALTEKFQSGPGKAADIAWLPDGSAIAVAGQDGVHLYQPDSLAEIASIGPQSAVVQLAFDPGGRYLAARTAAGLEVWGPSSQADYAIRLGTFQSKPKGIGFLQGGERLALLDGERLVVWDIPTWSELSSRDYGSPYDIYAVQPEGSLVGRLASNVVRVWDTSTWNVTDTLSRIPQEDSHFLNSLAFSPDGRLAAAGDNTGGLYLWRLPGGEVVENVLLVDSGPWTKQTSGFVLRFICDLAFSPDSNWLALAGEDGRVYLRDLSSGVTTALGGHGSAVTAVRFSPDGSRLLSLDESSRLRLWELPTGRPLGVLDRYRGGIKGLLPLPSGDLLTWQGERLWAGLPLEVPPAPATLPAAVRAVSPDGHLAVLYGENWSEIQVYDLRAKTVKASFDLEGLPENAGDAGPPVALLALSPAHLAASGPPGLWLWELESGRLIAHLDASDPRYIPNILGFNPSGDVLAVELERSVLTLIGPDNGQVQGTIKLPESSHRSAMAFSPGGTRIAVFGWSRIAILDIASGAVLTQVEIPYQAQGYPGRDTASLAFNPAGDLLALAGGDGRLYLWDPNSLDLLAVLGAEGASLAQVAFSLDGQQLLAGGRNGLIYAYGP